MKCRQAQELIGAYLYGDLAPEEMRDLRVHAQECALCREDLASRGRVISALDDDVPGLTDEERQRIAWSVKGAVRREQLQRRPFVTKLVPAFALTGMLIAGVLVGRYVVIRPSQAHPHKSVAKNQSDVHIKELPTPDRAAKPDPMADQVAQLLQSLATPTGVIGPDRASSAGRSFDPSRRCMYPPDISFKVVPHDNAVAPVRPPVPDADSTEMPKDSTPSVNNTETGADSEAATRLPKVTDPKNAETTPSENK